MKQNQNLSRWRANLSRKKIILMTRKPIILLMLHYKPMKQKTKLFSMSQKPIILFIWRTNLNYETLHFQVCLVANNNDTPVVDLGDGVHIISFQRLVNNTRGCLIHSPWVLLYQSFSSKQTLPVFFLLTSKTMFTKSLTAPTTTFTSFWTSRQS